MTMYQFIDLPASSPSSRWGCIRYITLYAATDSAGRSLFSRKSGFHAPCSLIQRSQKRFVAPIN